VTAETAAFRAAWLDDLWKRHLAGIDDSKRSPILSTVLIWDSRSDRKNFCSGRGLLKKSGKTGLEPYGGNRYKAILTESDFQAGIFRFVGYEAPDKGHSAGSRCLEVSLSQRV